ncbi:MAG: sialate O-acetylesterase [Sphingobacteriaceae bacterium]|nr:sialate O-acetylesterase [Sphingobacteriaceae bacterium]
MAKNKPKKYQSGTIVACIVFNLKVGVLLITLNFFSIEANATVVLPALISDNMVMQQNAPVHIWGGAAAGEKISITILGQTLATVADNNGRWDVWLKPMKSNTAVSMTVAGTNTIPVKNILIGEVWLASGQSNMEWDVSQSNNASKEIAAANYPQIRIFDAARSFSDTLKSEISGKWVICSHETVKNITAAGYFFARGLNKKLAQPIGLIEASWGATNCQSWTSIDAIRADPRLSYVENDWQKYLNTYPDRQKAYQTAMEIWKDAADKAKVTGTETPSQPRAPQRSTKDQPSVIFNAVIAPLSNYTIRGVIWYQGEANAYARVAYPYRYLFPAMISSWRDSWKQGDFPFIFVQLSTLNKHPYWPMLRESQFETLKLANTAMVVSYDVGDSTDAHYKNKQTVGYRLELAARKLVYGENIEASGPVFRQMTSEGNSVRIWFDHAKGLKTQGRAEIAGFEIAGGDGKRYPARAIIDGENIVLSHPEVHKPAVARYAFKDAPVANLVNSAGLPAVPFRTDVSESL